MLPVAVRRKQAESDKERKIVERELDIERAGFTIINEIQYWNRRRAPEHLTTIAKQCWIIIQALVFLRRL